MRTIQDAELAAKYLSCLENGETPNLAAWLEFASVGGGADWRHPLLLVTSRRLIVSKERSFGTPRADFGVTWPEVSTVRSGPWHGTFDPLIELNVETHRDALALAVKNLYAVDIESAIRRAYLSNPDHPAHRKS